MHWKLTIARDIENLIAANRFQFEIWIEKLALGKCWLHAMFFPVLILTYWLTFEHMVPRFFYFYGNKHSVTAFSLFHMTTSLHRVLLNFELAPELTLLGKVYICEQNCLNSLDFVCCRRWQHQEVMFHLS